MEMNPRSPPLVLLLALPLVLAFTKDDCPPPDKNLTCSNDLNRIISCRWIGTGSARPDAMCRIHAERQHSHRYNASCQLEPVDPSRPEPLMCSMVFKNNWTLISRHKLTIRLSCDAMKESWSFSYSPKCHVKLDPPPKPELNSTTVSWIPQAAKHQRVEYYNVEVQWREEEQPWRAHRRLKQCIWFCSSKHPDELKGASRFEVHIRVQAQKYLSEWSDWSPSASWVSPSGRATPDSDVTKGMLGFLACAVAVVLVLVLLKTDRTTWVYIVKRIRGPPLPNPGQSFLQDFPFQNWVTPPFFSTSFHSLLTPVEIVSVEVSSTQHSDGPSGPEAGLLERMRRRVSQEKETSSFSNPTYSLLSPAAPPVFSLTAGSLEACDADTPYGPVVRRDEDKREEEEQRIEDEILKMLSGGSGSSETIPVISDYEKVEEPGGELLRLQRLDSGVCSGEEVSQESLEADGCQEEEPQGQEEREGGNREEEDLLRLFRSGGDVPDKSSIQVSSCYEQVQLRADLLVSGLSTAAEEQGSREDFLLPPLAAPSFSSFALLPSKVSEAGLSPGLILEKIFLLSSSGSVAPSAGGYLPVTPGEPAAGPTSSQQDRQLDPS